MKRIKTPPFAGFLIFNFAFFMMDTTAGYFSIYLNEIGMTKTEIGMITAISSLVALCFQPMLGLLADRAKSKNQVLQILILSTALLYPLILLSSNMFYILLLYVVYTTLRRCQPSLNNSMSLEYAEQSGIHYGPLRMMGAVGYAAMMAVVGQIANIGTKLTFTTYTAICLFNILLIFLLPKIQGHQGNGTHQPISSVLKNGSVIKLVIFAMMMSLAQGMYHSYFAIFFTSELGGSSALYGTMLSISAMCEIPFLFFADRIIRRLGTKRTLFFICIADSARWFATFFVKTPGMQIVIQSMNFLNILMGVAVSLKLSQLAAPQFKTTVQTLASTVQSVASLLISSLLGGILADTFGIRPLFLLAGGISLITAVTFHFFVFKDSLSTQAPGLEA